MPSRAELGFFVGIFRGSYKSIQGGLIAVGIAVVFGACIGLLQGGSLSNLSGAGPELFLMALGLAAFFLLFARYHAVRIYSDGIEGKSYWSRSVRFYWRKIEDVRLDSSNRIAAVVLTESDSGREMWIFREVFLRDDFQAAILPYLEANGSSNPK